MGASLLHRLALTLWLVLCAGLGCTSAPRHVPPAVRVTYGSMTLRYLECLSIGQVDPAHPRAMQPLYGTETASTRSFATVELTNEFLRIVIVPEMAGAVARVQVLATGDDLFFWENQAKNYLPYWESGLKVSFPFREHGTTLHQPVGWRVVPREDGSVTFAAWSEFSRFDIAVNRWIYGRYSDMFLSQQITLAPGRNTFTATWRLVNPAPYRQGRRLWADATFPREHDAQGAVQAQRTPPRPTLTQWIFPATWVSSHGGATLRPYDQAQTRLADYATTMSIFGWDLRYGFAGLYYPRVNVNRLVVWDPAVSPGAKQWFDGERTHFDDRYSLSFKYNLVELWVGSDAVFEGVEQWLGPGQVYAFTQQFLYVRDMGKVDYANAHLAINCELDGERPRIEVVTCSPARELVVRINEREIGPAQACDAVHPARWALPAPTGPVTVTIDADGQRLLDQVFPLPLGDPAQKPAARPALERSPQQLEKDGNSAHFGETFRAAASQYPPASLGRGRCLYRDGYLRAAERTLHAAAQVADAAGEAQMLLALALWEQHGAADARVGTALEAALTSTPPYLPALHWRAVRALAQGQRASAAADLERLIAHDDRHWEAQLLHAWVRGTASSTPPATALAHVARLEQADPADPRLAWVHLEVLTHHGASPAARAAQARVLDQLLAEPGAAERLEQFRQLTRGNYVPPRRLGY